jgi:hypothetical protein
MRLHLLEKSLCRNRKLLNTIPGLILLRGFGNRRMIVSMTKR